MQLFSLNWFKSKIEQKIEKAVDKKIDGFFEQEVKNVKLVNNVLTVVLSTGDILTKNPATEDDYYAVKNAGSIMEIHDIISSNEYLNKKEELKKAKEKEEKVVRGYDILKNSKEFVVKEDSVYLSGISRSLPPMLVEEFAQIATQENFETTEEFLALKRFFMWCCLNSRAEVADDLYGFLKKNSFRITKEGFFAALRNVVSIEGGKEFVDFISNSYTKVKAVWKKSPDNYTVFKDYEGNYKMISNKNLTTTVETIDHTCPNCDGEGVIWDEYEEEYEECLECEGTGEITVGTPITYEKPIDYGENLGNLTELYLDLPNRQENRYTDDWTRTFDIRIGRKVEMPQEECDWSRRDCAAAGLHFTSDQIHYVGCGDTSVLVLINPMTVVGIGEHKGRCYEYFPIMTVPREEATNLLHDLNFDTLQIDSQYALDQIEELEQRVRNNFVNETNKYQFNLPNISTKEIKDIVRSLDDIKSEIENRVVKVN